MNSLAVQQALMERKRVLVVDDDPMIVTLAADLLEAAEFDVTTAGDVKGAIFAADMQAFDVILLDMQLPDGSGYEVCRAVRASPKSSRATILFLTGNGSAEHVAAAFEAGATDFLPKPIHPPTLAFRIDQAIRMNSLLLQQPIGANSTAGSPGTNRLRAGSGSDDTDIRALAARFETALLDQRPWMAYQTQTRLKDGRIHSVEALMRWRDPVLGDVAPKQFVAACEFAGMDLPLLSYSLRRAADEIGGLNEEFGLGLKVAVNLPAATLQLDELPAIVAGTLAGSLLHPSQLELEITENALLTDLPRVSRILDTLRLTGVRVSLDDFGTGFSTLSHLRCLPVDAIKIDKSFVDGIAHDQRDRMLVCSIVTMGTHLGLGTVAEGVETRAQYDHLVGLGCDYAQGYLFSRPVPLSELHAMITANSATFDSRV